MAIPGYVPTAVPACLDTPTINTWLQSTNQLVNPALTDTGGIKCVGVTGSLARGDCMEIKPVATVQETGKIEKKILLGSALITARPSFNVDDHDQGNGSGRAYVTLELRCNGTAIASQTETIALSNTPQTNQILASLNMFGECPAVGQLELCSVVRVTGLESGYGDQVEVETVICAAVLCIRGPYTNSFDAMTGFCCAPEIPADCTVGREGLYLLQQNATALCGYLSQGDQFLSCDYDATTAGLQPIQVLTATDTINYLVFGSVTACVENAGPGTGAVNVTPTISCGGDQQQCPGYNIILPGPGATEGPLTKCIQIPVIACGTCQPGDAIVISNGSEIQCDSTISTGAVGPSVSIVSAEQSYTVFTFGRTDPIAEGLIPAPVNSPLPKCVPRSSVENLVAKIDSVHDYLCGRQNREPYCNYASATYQGRDNVTGELIVRPPFPLPNPPPDPLPTPWPPLKKTMLTGSVIVCVDVNGLNDQNANFTIEILCAGAVVCTLLETVSLQNPQADEGYRDNKCTTVPIAKTVTCEINQPVSVRVTGVAQSTGDVVNLSASPRITAFCL